MYCTICNNHLISILLSLYYRWWPCPVVHLRHRLWKWYKINAGHVFSILIPTVAVAYSSWTSFLRHHSYLFVKEGYTTTLFTNTACLQTPVADVKYSWPLYHAWCQKFPEQWKTVYSLTPALERFQLVTFLQLVILSNLNMVALCSAMRNAAGTEIQEHSQCLIDSWWRVDDVGLVLRNVTIDWLNA